MSEAQAQTITAKPNIVFILTDDMRKDDMMYMPKTHSLLREQGMGFRLQRALRPFSGQYNDGSVPPQQRCLV